MLNRHLVVPDSFCLQEKSGRKFLKDCFKSYSAKGLVQVLAVFTWGLAPSLIFEGNSMDAATEANRNSKYKVLCTEMRIYSESGT